MTDDNKPIDLKEVRHTRAMAEHDRAEDWVSSAAREGVDILWDFWAEALEKMPGVPVGNKILRMCSDPEVVFERQLSDLVSKAKAKGVNNEQIMEALIGFARECGPEGRLSELVDKAYSLMLCGNEDHIACLREKRT
jgi:hypothetical protein